MSYPKACDMSARALTSGYVLDSCGKGRFYLLNLVNAGPESLE